MNLFSDNKVPYHNATSYDSNAALGGQMENIGISKQIFQRL